MELDEKCSRIMSILSNSGRTYKQLQNETKFNDVTLSDHLRHLKESELIVNINKQYQINSSQKTVTTPYSYKKLELEMKLISHDKEFERFHCHNIRILKNEIDTPLTKNRIILRSDTPEKWKDLNFSCIIFPKGDKIPLYDKNNNPEFLINNPYEKKFFVKFDDYPLYKNEEMKILIDYDSTNSVKKRYLDYSPTVYVEQTELIFTFPKNYKYNVNVYEVDTFTEEETLSSKPPQKHTAKTTYQYVWHTDNPLPPHHRLRFKWFPVN